MGVKVCMNLMTLLNQVAIALQFVHNIGIIYRDLKSDNVLVWSVDPKDKGRC